MPSARPIWKGQVTFGLVNLPVTLYSAEQRQDIQLHLIDSRDSARVRYQRVNEDTGEEVPWDQIVKGYEFDGGQYVLLEKEEMENLAAKLTKEIAIEDFVSQEDILPEYFDKPYYLEPQKGATKSYALLRETLRASGKVGVTRVVIRSKEHLAILMVRGDYLMLELLRFPQEIRSPEFLEVPGSASGDVNMSRREVDLALQLVDNMTSEWNPAAYRDEYRETLRQYVDEKIKSGHLTVAKPPPDPEEEEEAADNVVDLMDYLKESIAQTSGKKPAGRAKKTASRSKKKKPAKKAAAKKAANRKTAKKKTASKKSAKRNERSA